MEERLSIRRESGMNRSTLRLWGLVFVALGLLSRGILQNRVLGLQSGSNADLLQILNLSGAMTAAAVALALEGMESCAVPIFATLLEEGFRKTHSAKDYLLRVLGVAVVSELPYNFAISGSFWDVSSRNPVFGMVLALAMLIFLNQYSGKGVTGVLIQTAVFAAAILWSVMFRVKYGIMMLIVTAVLWAFRARPTLRYFLAAAAAICCCVGNPLYMFAPFGFLLVHLYNGEEGQTSKLLQYILYPVLLILVGAVGFLLF